MNKKVVALTVIIALCCILIATPAFAETNAAADNSASTADSSKTISTDHLAGTTIYETARVISEHYNSGKLKNVIFSTGNNFADALSVSVFAHKKEAPILLVDSSVDGSKDAFDYVTQHLDPRGTVYIIGGTGIISSEFETKLDDLGFKNTVRIAGEDRYETSYKVAGMLNNAKLSTVVISSGEQYPDALSISSVAANKEWPILLSPHDSLPSQMVNFLAAKKPSKIYLTGGTAVISDNIVSEIKTLLPKADIVRLAGECRFDTNAIVTEAFSTHPSTIYLATGYDFADALAGSVLAAKNGDPIILIDPSVPTLPEAAASYFEKLCAKNLIPKLVFLGGSGTVPDEIMKNSSDLILGTKQATSIYSIADLSANITQDENYTLPATVQARLYNSDMIDVPVNWNSEPANNGSIGLRVYDGTVDGYSGTIKLNLMVTISDIDISGRSATLIDVATGTVLFSKNPTNQEYPASITKLMTALLVYKSGIPLTTTIHIGDSVQDSSLRNTTLMGLRQGDSITLGDLLTATLLGSYNDGANALAQAVSGSAAGFVGAMNAEASALGMKNTHFSNPSGLPDSNHYTTAEDMAIMARFIVTNYPQILDITSKSSLDVTLNGNLRTITNINHIIDYGSNFLGLKTGYTQAADNTIIALEKVGTNEAIAVILKSPGYALYGDAYKLLTAGIKLYN